jgi:hypothetical protein
VRVLLGSGEASVDQLVAVFRVSRRTVLRAVVGATYSTSPGALRRASAVHRAPKDIIADWHAAWAEWGPFRAA